MPVTHTPAKGSPAAAGLFRDRNLGAAPVQAIENLPQPVQPEINGLRMNLRLVGQPLLETTRHGRPLCRGGFFAGQQTQHAADALAQLAPIDDHVEGAMLRLLTGKEPAAA